MTSDTTSVRRGFWRSLWSKKWLVIVPAIVSTVVTLVITRTLSVRYMSEGTVQVEPQRVPEAYFRSSVTTDLRDRLRSIQVQIMSRTRLERIIEEYNLYPEERRSGLMEDVVQRMRRDIVVGMKEGDVFSVAYSGDNPRTVMKVADRLASLFIDENTQERERLATGTNQFLDSTVYETKRRLLEYEKRIASGKDKSRATVVEFEALQEVYKSLLLKQADAQIATNLERRQIGENFKLLDPARLPETPIGLSHRTVNVIGALSGLIFGLVLAGFASGRKQDAA
jgi:uncharacterized protein involved in exopolysaccharide biosynthesis